MTGDEIFEVARIAPASADTVFSLVAMLLGDALRDRLDPRLRGR